MTTFIFYIIKMMEERSYFRSFLEGFVTTAIFIFVLLKFLIFPCQVEGTSMYPTLKDKQRGYSFICTRIIGINRFDICVINVDDGETHKKLVKRVIGMPFDTVDYVDNKLYINGEYYEEPFLGDVTTEDLHIELGEDEYFCLGDNRNVSRDSRYYGAFKKENFKSTHLLVIYPFEEFGFKS